MDSRKNVIIAYVGVGVANTNHPVPTVAITTNYGTYLDSLLHLELSRAEHDNWDGEGARAVDSSTIRKAIKFLTIFSTPVAQPSISAGYDGSIGLSWHRPELNLFVNVSIDGPIDFSFSLARHRFRYSKRVMPDDPHIADELRPTFSYLQEDPSTISLLFAADVAENTMFSGLIAEQGALTTEATLAQS